MILATAAIGVKLTGVDSSTFSLTGEAYSTIVPPKTESTASRVLQKGNMSKIATSNTPQS